MSQQMPLQADQRPNQVVHIRENSADELEKLFNVAKVPPNKEGQTNTLPLRMRKLPASFFNPPDPERTHSRQGSHEDNRLPSFHSRVHSSPASLQATLSAASPSPSQHMRHQSYDLLDEVPRELPPGWEVARTPNGQRYFLNHMNQTTQWEDPRKTLSQTSLNQTTSPVQSQQNLGPLPPGWEQATTPDGEVYFINHIERGTSWFDPRIPMHLQRPGPMRQVNPHVQVPPHPMAALSPQQVNQQQQQVPPTQQQSKSRSLPQMSESERMRQMELQRLQIEKERLRLRQEEINRQYSQVQQMMVRQTIAEDSTNIQQQMPVANDMQSVNTSGVDPFLGQVQHPRQESSDSGLGGMGTNYSLPRTPEDFLMNVEEMDTQDSGHKMQPNGDFSSGNIEGLSGIPEGGEHSSNMDSDDLVPSLQEDISSELLNDMESVLNHPDNLTWL